jgi:hypothetical protein
MKFEQGFAPRLAVKRADAVTLTALLIMRVGGMPQNRRSRVGSIALAAIWSLACAIQIAAAQPPSDEQGLWVADGNYISEFQGAPLASGGTLDAHLAFGIKDYRDPFSIAFDRQNNVWITDLSDLGSDLAIMEVRRADIVSLKSGTVAKHRSIIPVGVGVIDSGWVGIGFEEAGALFASNGQQLLEIPRDRLRKTRPSPSIDISEIGSTFVPGAIRFDASNNLWMTPGSFQLLRFAPDDRAASGPPNPGMTVNLLSNFFIVKDLAFDRSGNLWLAGESLQGMGLVIAEAEMISAADLEGSGWISPSPSLIITSSAFGSGPCLGGLDFDRSGDLWVSVIGSNTACQADTQLVEFTPSQLSTGGNLTPSVTIGQNMTRTNLYLPGPIRFGPTVE